jgi:hypothetical protein
VTTCDVAAGYFSAFSSVFSPDGISLPNTYTMSRFFSLLLASGLLACGKTTIQTGQLVALVPKQPATLALGGLGNVEATLTDLSDSRCPSDVVCISAGNVAAVLTLADGAATQTVRLGYQKNYLADSVSVTLHRQAYWVRILDVTPYPTKENIGQLRTAVVRLRPA